MKQNLSAAARTAVALFLFAAASGAFAQEDPKGSWSVQGDVGSGSVPRIIVEQASDLYEKPDITGQSYSFGIARLHLNGAPSYSLEFTSVRSRMYGSVMSWGVQREIEGQGTLNGFMASKYVNIVVRRHWSAGFLAGAGYGRIGASYSRRDILPDGTIVPQESNAYRYHFPAFQLLAYADIRPSGRISFTPYYGMKTGLRALGVQVRFRIGS